MGKTFITDEVNDTYTAKVSSGKKLYVETGASNYKMLPSACSTSFGGYTVLGQPGWLKSVLIGGQISGGTVLRIFDTSASGNSSADGLGISACSTAFGGVSGANWVVDLNIDATGGLYVSGQRDFPRIFDFNVYCASGIVAQIGDSGDLHGSGGLKGCIIYYQAG